LKLARIESDREDLMREAVALVWRVELRLAGLSDAVVAGFRRDGCLSIYFGADPYYQFDAEGRLRRARLRNRLFRSQGSTLAQLERVRSERTSELRRQDLSAESLAQFFQEMRASVSLLRAAIEQPGIVVRQIPVDAAIIPRLALSLDNVLSEAGTLAPAVNRVR
jgi:hypothetical protein